MPSTAVMLKFLHEPRLRSKFIGKECIKDTMLYTNYDRYNAMQCNTNKLTFDASPKGKVKGDDDKRVIYSALDPS